MFFSFSNTVRLGSYFAIVWICVSANAEAQNRTYDERDILREAEVFHVLFSDSVKAEQSLASLKQVEPRQQLERFSRLATELSEDKESGARGGALGLIKQGTLDDLFGIDILSLPPNEIVGPVRSRFGWHLIYLANVKQRSVSSLCHESLQASISSALGATRDQLAISVSPIDMASLYSTVSRLVGATGWSRPLKSADGDLILLRIETLSNGETKSLVQHTEFIYAKYRPQNGSCIRSRRELHEVDCHSESLRGLRSSEFEGRGAVGEPLEVKEILGWMLPAHSGFALQMVGYACQMGDAPFNDSVPSGTEFSPFSENLPWQTEAVAIQVLIKQASLELIAKSCAGAGAQVAQRAKTWGLRNGEYLRKASVAIQRVADQYSVKFGDSARVRYLSRVSRLTQGEANRSVANLANRKGFAANRLPFDRSCQYFADHDEADLDQIPWFTPTLAKYLAVE